MPIHSDDIADENKIASLLAISVTVGPLKELRHAGVTNLMRELVDRRGHLALEGFARTKNVKIAKANDRGRQRAGQTPHVAVELEF